MNSLLFRLNRWRFPRRLAPDRVISPPSLSLMKRSYAFVHGEPSENVVRLNIGGLQFETTRATLERSAYFKARLSGPLADGSGGSCGDRGPLFVDRSAALFEHVLAWLRNGLRPAEAVLRSHRDALLEECAFYGLDSMAQTILGKTSPWDLRPEDRAVLEEEEAVRSGKCADAAEGDGWLLNPWSLPQSPAGAAEELSGSGPVLFKTAAASLEPPCLCSGPEEFRTRLASFLGGEPPLLQALNDMELPPGTRVLVAGGAVCAALCGVDAKDVDLFLVCPPAEAEAVLRQIHEAVKATHLRDGRRLLVTRTATTVTFFRAGQHGASIQGPPIQVVLDTYQSRAEVLSFFDICCCTALYDCSSCEVLVSPRFVRALRFRCNLVDTCYDSESYPRRLEKYAGRGFQAVVPGLLARRLSPQLLGSGCRYAYVPELDVLLQLGERKVCQGPLRLTVRGKVIKVVADFSQKAGRGGSGTRSGAGAGSMLHCF